MDARSRTFKFRRKDASTCLCDDRATSTVLQAPVNGHSNIPRKRLGEFHIIAALMLVDNEGCESQAPSNLQSASSTSTMLLVFKPSSAVVTNSFSIQQQPIPWTGNGSPATWATKRAPFVPVLNCQRHQFLVSSAPVRRFKV